MPIQLAKRLHLDPALRSTGRRADGNDDDIKQRVVPHALHPRIINLAKVFKQVDSRHIGHRGTSRVGRRHELPSLATPMPGMVSDLIARATPNARCRKLLRGDWSEYPSQSETEAAFCMHLAWNGGDLLCILAALRQPGLSRSKLRLDDYVFRTALFAVSTSDVRLPHWHEADPAADADTLAQARQQLVDSPLASVAPLLLGIAESVVIRVVAGKTP